MARRSSLSSPENLGTQAVNELLGEAYRVVRTVEENMASVVSVAENMADINEAIEVVDDILAAADLASNKAAQASASADTAVAAKVASEAARDLSENAWEDFDAKYLGSKATNPTLDNQGGALIDGAIIWHNVVKEFRVYDLLTTVWVSFTAESQSAEQTPFTSSGGLSADNVQDALEELDTEKATDAALSAHIGDNDNPHSVTKFQVGLGSAENTADLDKPISTAQAAVNTALDGRLDTLEQGWLTGDIKFTMDPIDQVGWIEAAGLSIGNGASGATGRANADTANLFAFFWHATRRAAWSITIQASDGAGSTFGADAATDFAANKRLVMPDISKRFPRSSGSGLDVGTKETNQNKAHTHAGSSIASNGSHTHNVSMTANGRFGLNASASNEEDFGSSDSIKGSGTRHMTVSTDGAHTHDLTIASDGGTEARPDSFVVRALVRL